MTVVWPPAAIAPPWLLFRPCREITDSRGRRLFGRGFWRPLDALAQPREHRGRILAQGMADQCLGNPEAGLHVHLVLDDRRCAIGSRCQYPGPLLLLEVPAQAMEVDAARAVIVRTEDVADHGQVPGVVHFLLEVLPAAIGSAVDTAAGLESRHELERLPAVGHHLPDRLGLRPDEHRGADPAVGTDGIRRGSRLDHHFAPREPPLYPRV